jgi:delta 1-pyrroline-5-carboxylate dehydrogenase
VLHVVRYKAKKLDAVLDAIDATGFGLTLGVHSRIEATVRKVIDRLDTGNVYVNRNMIGAVVGTQPFRRLRPVGHRLQGRRPALPDAVRGRAGGLGQHGRCGRQCRADRMGDG